MRITVVIAFLVFVAVQADAAIMTVKAKSDRVVTQGSSGTFVHEIALTGGFSVANQVIGIDDPVAGMSTTVKTNTFGIATYTSRPYGGIQPGFYSITFMSGNQKIISAVAIRAGINIQIKNLPHFTVPVNTQVPTDPNFTVLPGTYKGITFPDSKTGEMLLRLGGAVISDYLSNPVNVGVVLITAVTCTAGQALPAAGQALCATGISVIAKGVATSTVKVSVKMAIDATSIPAADKTKWKAAVDAGAAVVSLATFDPGSAGSAAASAGSAFKESATLMGAGWGIASATSKVVAPPTGGEGLAIAGKLTGSGSGGGKFAQISLYKKK